MRRIADRNFWLTYGSLAVVGYAADCWMQGALIVVRCWFD